MNNCNQKEKSTCCPVYSQRMAGWLMFQGFTLIQMMPNNRYPEKNVFFFRDSLEIKDHIQQYLTANR